MAAPEGEGVGGPAKGLLSRGAMRRPLAPCGRRDPHPMMTASSGEATPSPSPRPGLLSPAAAPGGPAPPGPRPARPRPHPARPRDTVAGGDGGEVLPPLRDPSLHEGLGGAPVPHRVPRHGEARAPPGGRPRAGRGPTPRARG